METHLTLADMKRRHEECIQAALEARDRARHALEEAEAFESFAAHLEADIQIAAALAAPAGNDVSEVDMDSGWRRLATKAGSS